MDSPEDVLEALRSGRRRILAEAGMYPDDSEVDGETVPDVIDYDR